VPQRVEGISSSVFANEDVEAGLGGQTGKGIQARAHISGVSKADDQDRHAETISLSHARTPNPQRLIFVAASMDENEVANLGAAQKNLERSHCPAHLETIKGSMRPAF
jgi:hypothetical protein